MSGEKDHSLDIFGIKDFGKATDKTIEAAIKLAEAFLSTVCGPATNELGLLFGDRVSYWRAKQAIKIAYKTHTFYEKYKLKGKLIHPRLVYEALEKGSLCDDGDLQSMWGGLLASSCCEDGKDDSNIIFTGLLSQMTSIQVKILNHSCENASKYITKGGLPFAHGLPIKTCEINNLTGIKDLNRLDFELDHLRKQELISEGFNVHSTESANITPTPLALNLYVRCHGYIGSPEKYWDLKKESDSQNEKSSGDFGIPISTG